MEIHSFSATKNCTHANNLLLPRLRG